MVIRSRVSQRSDRVIHINEPPLNFNTARDDADVVQKVAFGSAIIGQVAGQTILPAVTVNIEDRFGNIVTNSSSQVTIGFGANPSAATLFGTLTVSAVNGVATFTDLAISLAGVGYTFNASSGAFGVVSPAFNVFAPNLGGSALSILSGSSQSAPVTQSLAVPLSVRVLDAGSNPVPGATITWASLTSGGAVQATTSVANAMGVAQVVASLGTSTGQYSFSASTYSGASVFFSTTATGGPAVSISFFSVPSQVTSGSPLSPMPQASALDQYGNWTTSTCTIFLSIAPSSPSGATLNGWYPGQALGGSNLIIMAAQAGAYALKATCSTMTATSPTFQLSLATDPKGAFVAAGQFVTPRFDHSATLLQDGRVLLAGGYDTNGVALKSAEIFNPGTNSFQATGSLAYERANHTATLMQDGTVLFVGGTLSDDPYGTYELYNPSTGLFQSAGIDPNGILGRTGHTATLLWDGTVLITGGGDRRTFQGATNLVARYRPGGGFYTATMNSNRFGHTAVLLPNDQVLIFGGESPDNGTAETYDRHGNVGNLYYFNYTQHPAFAHGSIGESALLPSGNVFGWRDNILYETATGLFDTLSFNPPAPYVASRNVLLPSGKMLVTGDSGTGSFLLDPMNGNSTSSTDNPGFLTSVISSATLLTDGSVFYAGGLLSSGVVNSAGSRFIPATPPISNLRLDFGLTAIGSSPTAVATFHNSSSAAVIVTSIAAPSGWFTASGLPTLPLTLGAGQSVSINVAFAPQYSEVEFNQLALLYAGGSATATVTGTGAQPAQLWCSDPTDFGNVGLSGQANATVSCRNLGGVPLTITGSTAPSVPFGATNLPATNSILNPNQSVNVTASFSPSTLTQSNGSFTVTSSNGGSTTPTLTGHGVAATFTMTPTPLAFGSVATNASGSQSITLKDNGTPAITVTSITMPTAPFSVTGLPAVGGTIRSGSPWVAPIVFAPSAQVTSSGSLTVVTNGGAATVSMTGTGVAPAQLVATPASVNFGSVGTSVKANVTVTLSNPGGVSLKFTGNTAPTTPFSATGLPATNATLAAGASISVTSSFTPTTQTTSSGSFVVTSNAGNVTVLLTGTGVAPAHLAASPTSLAFGNVPKNSFTTLSLTFSNTGGVPLTVTSVTSPSAPYSATGLPAVNATIGAGQQVTATIKFAPTATGASTGHVTLGSSGGSVTVNLTGSGT